MPGLASMSTAVGIAAGFGSSGATPAARQATAPPTHTQAGSKDKGVLSSTKVTLFRLWEKNQQSKLHRSYMMWEGKREKQRTRQAHHSRRYQDIRPKTAAVAYTGISHQCFPRLWGFKDKLWDAPTRPQTHTRAQRWEKSTKNNNAAKSKQKQAAWCVSWNFCQAKWRRCGKRNSRF